MTCNLCGTEDFVRKVPVTVTTEDGKVTPNTLVELCWLCEEKIDGDDPSHRV